MEGAAVRRARRPSSAEARHLPIVSKDVTGPCG
jgi:hypothetical protein